MKPRTAVRLAWSLWGFALLLVGAGMVVNSFNRPLVRTLQDSLFVLIFGSMALVGAMIAARQHRNAVGWIFLATGVIAGVAFLSDEYSRYVLVTNPGALPGA